MTVQPRAPVFRGKGTIAPLVRLLMAVGLVEVFVGWAALAQTQIPPTAQDFAMSVAQTDEYEIQAGWDAAAQTHNPRIRAFAQQMIDDHTRSSKALRQATAAAGLTSPPPSMSSDQAEMLSALQSVTGSDFDQAYARQQVLAHTQALAVEQNYAATGTDPNLRKVATSTLPVIRRHLKMAEQIRSALGGS